MLFAATTGSAADVLNSILAYEAANWVSQLLKLVAAMPSIIVALTPYPKIAGFAKTLLQVLNVFSILTHRDSPNTLKPPLVQSLPPGVVGQQVAAAPIVLKLLLVGLLLPQLMACAAVSWSSPVFYAGPTVAPIEEVSAHSTPAVAGGFKETLGLGQYEAAGHEWDLIDLGLLQLGGLVPGGAGPAGMLQLGGSVGTLNGIVGLGLLFDCVDSAGAGVCEGGPGTGPIYAALFDVQALVAYFSPPARTGIFAPRLPRGGL